MSKENNNITVFEHQAIKLNEVIDGIMFDGHKLKALQGYFGEKGVPYFSLIHNGVRFSEYVGVIQVGETIFEVLPKADKNNGYTEEKTKWRKVLIGMLKAVGSFDIRSTGESNLKIHSNTILDLYFEMFLKEIEYLLHTGLIKKYRKKEGNVTALKGSLQFSKHIQENLTHQERFYVKHTKYDVEHKMHFILYKAIRLLKQLNTNSALHSRIGGLLLNFPEMPDMKVLESTFERIVYNRKIQAYKKSIEIARLLLLQYHPDVSKGRNNVLALMFDMNKLWEQFVYVSLRKHKQAGTTITAQTSKYFWKPLTGSGSRMRPDIVLNKGTENCTVLDTKWKNLNGYQPSPEDLRQMYVYHKYYAAKKVALIYPGLKSEKTYGNYSDPITGLNSDEECSIITVAVLPKIKLWQEEIGAQFQKWMD